MGVVVFDIADVASLADPTDPQQMHGYSYANNNPTTLSDPTGLAPCGDLECNQKAIPKPGGGWDIIGKPKNSVPSCAPNCGNPKDQVDDAADRLAAAKAREAALKRKMVKLGKLFLNIVMEITGIQAGIDCFLKGDIGGCIETAVTVVTGLLGGLLAKIGLKYAVKWKAAARLIGKVKTLVGGIIDVAKNWGKVADGVADAEKAYKAAKASAKAARATDDAAEDAARLTARADELSSPLDPIAKNSRTSAALSTREGVDVLAGGGRDLSPVQRALARAGDVIARAPGDHAEVTAVSGAKAAGLTPKAIGVSRDICSECQTFLKGAGAIITGPRTARW